MLIFFVCEGRQMTEGVNGLTTADVANILLDLGCTEAINLDGGGSTTMWIKDNGVVNHTCDGSWDARVERRVSSILYLK